MHANDTNTLVQFRSRRATRMDPRGLMAAVYAAGSISLAADDHAARDAAATLAGFGFLAIDEVAPDGALRRLTRAEHPGSDAPRPWRVSRPAFGGAQGVPEAFGEAGTAARG